MDSKKFSIHQKLINELLGRFSVINIYGKSGMGKSTYGLQLLKFFLEPSISVAKSKIQMHFKSESIYKHPEMEELEVNEVMAYAIWIQASELFSKNRFITLFKDQPNAFDYMQNHTLILPKGTCKDYYQMSILLNKLSGQEMVLPPNIAVIVIDNISHHLRFEIGKVEDVQLTVSLLDDFFDSVMMPLFFFCGSQKIKLVLIHEVSYNPKQNKTIMFNHNLFGNIKAFNIELVQETNIKQKVINYHFYDRTASFRYELTSKGLHILFR
ncbi:MAG: putative DNA repair and recombination protein RadB [Promethearchaeota archaeon]|nr:MAG: putative DNA repair and recombination protein RadB [Candidatus Lokiarchaeota archaeon]